MYKPYVIVSPDYDFTSGGIKVMWGLFGHLLARGHEVYMNRKPAYQETIGIYPEIQNGNPANTETVVRYILNKPGVMWNGTTPSPTTFDPTDKLFYFSRLFGDTDDNHYLFLPIINLHVFKDQNKKRTNTAYFVGKGQNTALHPLDAIQITREMAQNQQELADILNTCRTLYCYDPITAMTEVSRLCGCRVVIIPSTYTLEEYMKYEPGMNGITWGDIWLNKDYVGRINWEDEDEIRKLDTEAFREHYVDMIKKFDKQLDLFIELTQ